MVFVKYLNKLKFLHIFLLLITFLNGCSNKPICTLQKNIEQLPKKQYWAYLCGLTSDFYSTEEVANREALARIGRKLNIEFIACRPTSRSAEFDDKLYWPHNTSEETLRTYKQIMDSIGKRHIDGFLGFSNGGFFLNQLVQFFPLNKPVISIGSAGLFHETSIKNTLYLLIGKYDAYHYNHAYSFYDKAKESLLDIHIIEYEGGHELPIDLLENLLAKEV